MTSDELRALRANLKAAHEATGRGGPDVPTTPAFVGRVFARVALPKTTGVFFSVNPVAILGTEGESRPGALSVDQSTTVLVYVVGSHVPQLDDYLVCRFVDYRWVAERFGKQSTVSQPGCPCNPMPATMAFQGNYATIFGPPGRDPTTLGCPTSTTLTAQTRPANFQHSSIVANNTVWMSPSFTFKYYTYDQDTGNYDVVNTTSGAAIVYWCQPQNGQVTCQIYDSANNFGAVNALLAQTGDIYTTLLSCSPFLWKYNATTSAWTGRTTLSAG